MPAYVIWCVLTFVPLGYLMWRIAPRRETLWLLAAFPGAYTNLAYGQNGFFSAAFLGGGLYLITRRPIMAGILFGLLTFKPHLGILVPLALICARQWTVFASAAATTALVGAASAIVFGMEPWTAFLDNLTGAASRVSEGLFPLHKMPSLYATLVVLGMDRALAIAVHGALAVVATLHVAWLWWKRGATPATMALLVAGTLLVLPYLYRVRPHGHGRGRGAAGLGGLPSWLAALGARGSGARLDDAVPGQDQRLQPGCSGRCALPDCAVRHGASPGFSLAG